MTFTRIHMLFLIWTVPALFLVCLYGMRKRWRILSRFSSPTGLKAIAPESHPTRRWVKACLLLFTLLLSAIALAGPQYGYQWRKIERKGIDIIIALDCSKSMLAQDIQPTRLERAKREVYDLLQMLKGDRVGLVAFAGTAFLQCPLTLDYQGFHLFLNALSPDFLPVGGTDINGAINTALNAFDPESTTEKAIVLITDGQATGADPREAAKEAAKRNVKVFCIGVGSTQGAPIPESTGGFAKDRSGQIVMAQMDEAGLEAVASLTGGSYVRSVAGDMDLQRIYEEDIRGKMDQAVLEGGRKQIHQDRYQWFLLVAVVAFIVELFILPLKRSNALLILSIVLASAAPAHASDLRENLRNGSQAYEQEKYEAALDYFTRAQVDSPQRPEIAYNLGNAAYKAKDYEAALGHYQQSLAGAKPPLKEKAYFNMGNTSYRLGKLKDAITHYEQALKLDPEDAQAKENLEFVKKAMEQQQQKQQQQSSSQEQKSQSDKNRKQDQESNENQRQQAKDQQKAQDQDQQQQQMDRSEAKEDKQRSSQDEQQNQQSSSASEQSESSKDAKSAPKTADQDEPRQQYGGEMKQTGDKSDKSQQQSQGTNGAQQQQSTSQEQASSNPAGGEKRGSSAEQSQALERLLNRLQDKPGAALIPHYQKREVERDW